MMQLAVRQYFFSYLCLVLKDSSSHWPDDGSSENIPAPGLPSGVAWYAWKTVLYYSLTLVTESILVSSNLINNFILVLGKI